MYIHLRIRNADARFIEEVQAAIARLLPAQPRAAIIEASLRNRGALIQVASLEEACEIANRIAPEHLELSVQDPDACVANIRHAGAIFLGRHTPEAIGDYIAGPSHVLPTSRTARFASGLIVLDFMKRSSLIGCDAGAFTQIARYGETLAQTEGLHAHHLSMQLRRSRP